MLKLEYSRQRQARLLQVCHQHKLDAIRIENNYLVTSSGVESLLDYPLELA